MKIAAVETVRPHDQPNVLFVLLHDEDGRTGLGEAFFAARSVERHLHTDAAPVLLGLDDAAPERVAGVLASYTGYAGAGVETRANGAVDIALWDLLGKRSGLPLCELLGGPVRTRLPVYNTCAGPGYVKGSTRQVAANWGLPDGAPDPLDDLYAFLNDPARLARELYDEGLRAMKVWPFDPAAEATGGTAIGREELAYGVGVVEAIRAELGFDMDVMVELHGLWQRPAATKIMNALAPLRPYWVEDPIRPDAVDALALLSRDTDAPIATGETRVGRRQFAPLLAAGAVDVVTVDVQWTGGVTEARKVAALADGYAVPVAPHDCTGPASLAACVHLTASQPNGLIQETVRAFLRTWYADLVTGLPEIADGHVEVPRSPGHGVALRAGVADRPDVTRTVTRRGADGGVTTTT
ncbi:MAG TPA: mandelate racemase/muconate lactonizing enzyme family protein [Streptosporangiaceae bacterium]